MDILRKGLTHLKNIDSYLEDSLLIEEYPEDRIQYIVDELYDFIRLDNDELYVQLFDTTSYTMVAELNRLMGKLKLNLVSELEFIGIDNLADYYDKKSTLLRKKCIEVIQEIGVLSNEYQKKKDFLWKDLPDDEMEALKEVDHFELDKIEGDFLFEFETSLNHLKSLSEKAKRMRQQSFIPLSVSDFTKKIETLEELAHFKLKDLTEVEDVFIDEIVVFIAYKAFVELGIIKEIDKGKFINQLRYRNRNLTLKVKNRQKKYAARVIYKLSNYVMPDYKDKWEQRMVEHFDLKSYDRIKNKKPNSEKLQRIDTLINVIDTSLNI